MTTLENIIENNQTLSRSQLKIDKGLVLSIQIKLRNLGLYPGGQWIDGDLGIGNTFTWLGLTQFCRELNLVKVPSDTVAINPKIASALIATKQLPFILEQAKNTDFILKKLTDIQKNSLVAANIGVHNAFIARTLRNSPFASEIDNYPHYLAEKPDGKNVVSYGMNTLLTESDKTVDFTDYPHRGKLPDIDSSGLDFLASNISHACVCVGSFGDNNSPIKTHWLGRNALSPQQFLSCTKFIGVLNAIEQINSRFPGVNLDDCVIESPKYKMLDLLIDMISYRKEAYGLMDQSNQIGVLFKRFTQRQELEAWIRERTGNTKAEFCGSYGTPPLITNPMIKDLSSNATVLKSTSDEGKIGNNFVSPYDLVRLITMLGWHLHLTQNTRFIGSQWQSLETLIRAMGEDSARYIDVALETLGVINVISRPVVISKVGFGESSCTYVAFVKLVDERVKPAKLRTFALALRSPDGSFETRDTNLAAAVTEIVRRVLTEELA
ncbi:MAG: hypothetical protein QNJ42_00115 [Crocosphaera sp.]|nr:hypothetical protein [Crocosphaera sp.]